MIVDTSAILALLLGEPGSDRIGTLLSTEPCSMSAATRVELGIVVEARSSAAGTQLLEELLARVQMRVVPVDADDARDAIAAWRRFGKGRHPAGLNFGDCFAYALAQRSGEPLLFVGDDFARTDVASA